MTGPPCEGGTNCPVAPQLHTPFGSFSCKTVGMVDDCAAVLNDGLVVCAFSVLFLTSLLPLLRPVLFTFDVVVAELDTLDLLLDPLLVVVVVLLRSSRLPMLFP